MDDAFWLCQRFHQNLHSIVAQLILSQAQISYLIIDIQYVGYFCGRVHPKPKLQKEIFKNIKYCYIFEYDLSVDAFLKTIFFKSFELGFKEAKFKVNIPCLKYPNHFLFAQAS